MRYRLMFGVGFASGYILGSRAGRERYEQIKRMAQRVVDNPTVQETAGLMGAKVSRATGAARTKVGDAARNRLPFMQSANGRHDDTGTGWPENQRTDAPH
ncbi:YtxH domain-containing protein [Streptosporangium sp. NBC_01810]|uniref:YtxH domain-containing protein n=1 Tax=Streptosporangium sp. NBC_01810 TaxID=2975951 RepID=UPI002DD9A1AC|nr:YtxH domain-containing protein [Streptosporangium sp. NBC_01810]WSA23330.1 YtxH domain-containing protein [Streptosporangium sp. NBC_01810]